MNDVGKYKELEEYMCQNNITLEGYFKHLGKRNTSLLNLSDDAYREYAKYFEELRDDVNEYDNSGKYLLTSQQRGALLEKMAGVLFFDGNAMFNKAINCRTVTNEIDILVSWNKIALQMGIDRAYEFMGKSFLCECKNYTGDVNVTYIGKFFSLMKVSNVKFGILFSRKGMSGKNIWVHGKGLARKIALSERIYIIDITWNDFEKIYNKETNIFNLINDKCNAMKNDINYDEYVLKHEMEDDFEVELEKIETVSSFV